MLALHYPLLFWSIALIPNVAFLLAINRFCKQQAISSLPWMGATLLMPFVSIPALYARFQPEEKQQAVFGRLFFMMLIMNLVFVFVAKVVDVSGHLQLTH